MSFPFWLSGSAHDDDPSPRNAMRSGVLGPRLVPAVETSEADEALIARVQAGDRKAFAELYTQHLQLLVAFAYGYLHSEAAAQDIVAELFVHLWEARGEWHPQHGIRAYLLTAVRHRALNATRHAARAQEILDSAVANGDWLAASEAPTSADEAMDVAQRQAILRRAIDRLSPDRRRAMLLRWRFGLTPSEIASAMDVPRAAVDQLISRGLKALREMVRE